LGSDFLLIIFGAQAMNIERPVKGKTENGSSAGPAWGSDYLAQVIKALELKYVALTPGASFRGLHDSLVNHLDNTDPQMLLCLHEEHTVSIAHGYTKVTGKPMGAIVHTNVGLMHATMAIFNAWCDRVPVLVFGATGAVDAAKRRPWIEWIHTSRDQGALVRDFTKWDDQPASLEAAAESMLRASMIAQTAPRAPVYVCFDVSLQEAPLPENIGLPQMSRFKVPAPALPPADEVAQTAALLANAKNPVILIGRVSRGTEGWQQRVALAEQLGARVLTDLKLGAAFPTAHPLHAAPPGLRLSKQGLAVLREADVVLSLDWVDLAGTLKTVWPDGKPPAKIIQCSVDPYIHRGWSMDYQGLAPMDVQIMCEPEALVPGLLDALKTNHAASSRSYAPTVQADAAPPMDADKEIGIRDFGRMIKRMFAEEKVCLIRLPLGWAGVDCDFNHPLDFLGIDGGGGVGSGPGMAIGAALALQGSDRLPVAILGDGDFMMGVSAIWTAARYKIPLLILVSNNRSFFNDEIHQERVAIQRDRPVENKSIGLHIGEPDIDIAAIATAQGATGIGPVRRAGDLEQVLTDAIAAVKAGQTCVVDIRVRPGYGTDA
jgi:thiamine pyrophosphate-dependent acetolactate synthase large subunit-like protein